MANCNQITLSASQTTFDCTDIGQNTVTLTVEDNFGNTATTDPPSAQCVSSFTQSLTGCITYTDIDNGSIDDCSINYALDKTSFSCADLGAKTITLTVSASETNFNCDDLGDNNINLTFSDPSGNSTSCNAILTLMDETPPVVDCSTDVITRPLGLDGVAVVQPFELISGFTDACGIVTIRFIDDSNVKLFSCDDIGV